MSGSARDVEVEVPAPRNEGCEKREARRGEDGMDVRTQDGACKMKGARVDWQTKIDRKRGRPTEILTDKDSNPMERNLRILLDCISRRKQ